MLSYLQGSPCDAHIGKSAVLQHSAVLVRVCAPMHCSVVLPWPCPEPENQVMYTTVAIAYMACAWHRYVDVSQQTVCPAVHLF